MPSWMFWKTEIERTHQRHPGVKFKASSMVQSLVTSEPIGLCLKREMNKLNQNQLDIHTRGKKALQFGGLWRSGIIKWGDNYLDTCRSEQCRRNYRKLIFLTCVYFEALFQYFEFECRLAPRGWLELTSLIIIYSLTLTWMLYECRKGEILTDPEFQ